MTHAACPISFRIPLACDEDFEAATKACQRWLLEEGCVDVALQKEEDELGGFPRSIVGRACSAISIQDFLDGYRWKSITTATLYYGEEVVKLSPLGGLGR